MKKRILACGIFLAVSCWTFGHEYVMDDGSSFTDFLAYNEIKLTGGIGMTATMTWPCPTTTIFIFTEER